MNPNKTGNAVFFLKKTTSANVDIWSNQNF